MTTTRDLVDAIDSGSSVQSTAMFEELIGQRVLAAIEARKAEITQNMFNSSTEQSGEDE